MSFFVFFYCVFFFQAEDGIRDLVRSRGLGDVYKRQDPQGIIDLRLLILQLKTEAKKTILLSSHILSEIELVADEMVIINKGKSIVQGKVNDLMLSLIHISEPTRPY